MFFKTNVLSRIYAGVVEININNDNDNDNLIFKPIKGDRKFVVMHGNTSISKSLTSNKRNQKENAKMKWNSRKYLFFGFVF